MSDSTLELPDDLDGCDIDFAEYAEDDEISQLRVLFPDGEATDEETEFWNVLAQGGVFPAVDMPRQATQGRDLDIANRLRRYGLVVVEVAGWQTRGVASLYADGSVDHHTAGGINGNAPSLYICTNGRSDLAGPLCNVLIARDNTCYVIASGRANHAGSGGWNGLAGNSKVFGVERENVGYADREPWRSDQTDTAYRCHAALLDDPALVKNLCRHAEWTPRKIDSQGITGDGLRAGTLSIYVGGPAPTPNPNPTPTPTPAPNPTPLPGGTYNMETIDLRNAQNAPVRGRHVDNLQGLLTGASLVHPPANPGAIDGVAGRNTKAALIAFQQGCLFLGIPIGGSTADAICGPATWKALIEF